MVVEAQKYLLKLYVTGRTSRSENAITTLREICRHELEERYELLIIDVLEHPEAAEENRILATPTVIKELPLPIRTIIGDLTQREKVLFGLDLMPNSAKGESS